MIGRTEVKVTVARLIEVAYSKNKGVTAKIVRSKGNFKIKVDKNGNVMLFGSVGNLAFRGDTALTDLGAKLKNATILFSKGDGDNINYTAMFSFSGAANISLSGSFDIEELITSCSGLLCRAARALKGRHATYERELQRIMGQ